jgi:hypothetical protein
MTYIKNTMTPQSSSVIKTTPKPSRDRPPGGAHHSDLRRKENNQKIGKNVSQLTSLSVSLSGHDEVSYQKFRHLSAVKITRDIPEKRLRKGMLAAVVEPYAPPTTKCGIEASSIYPPYIGSIDYSDIDLVD